MKTWFVKATLYIKAVSLFLSIVLLVWYIFSLDTGKIIRTDVTLWSEITHKKIALGRVACNIYPNPKTIEAIKTYLNRVTSKDVDNSLPIDQNWWISIRKYDFCIIFVLLLLSITYLQSNLIIHAYICCIDRNQANV